VSSRWDNSTTPATFTSLSRQHDVGVVCRVAIGTHGLLKTTAWRPGRSSFPRSDLLLTVLGLLAFCAHQHVRFSG
jgi:hypothetical protein